MKTKHVKGNWHCDRFGVYTTDITTFIEGNIVCLAPEHAEASMQYWEANAKLIAAAPELLKALLLIKQGGLGNFTQAEKDIINNAINKATK